MPLCAIISVGCQVGKEQKGIVARLASEESSRVRLAKEPFIADGKEPVSFLCLSILLLSTATIHNHIKNII